MCCWLVRIDNTCLKQTERSPIEAPLQFKKPHPWESTIVFLQGVAASQAESGQVETWPELGNLSQSFGGMLSEAKK